MSLRFPYQPQNLVVPAWTLYGATTRYRPIVSVPILGPLGGRLRDGLLDTGSDDTVFPASDAALIGVDLSNAPQGGAKGVGASGSGLRYAEVELRLTDGQEYRRWQARVGFTDTPLRYALLGHAGVLQFFTAKFDGDRHEVELTVNGTYPGT